MSEEAQYIIDHYGLQKTQSLATISFYENDKIVLALAGVGKIQASIATTLLLQNFHPSILSILGLQGVLVGRESKSWAMCF